MSLWYLALIVAVVLASWQVAALYTRKCRCTERQLSWHGALEFNATFFALQLLLLWFVGREKQDSWIAGAIGLALVFFVARRFWRNWDRSDAPN